MKKVLLTGSNSLIGQKIQQQLNQLADFSVIATSRSSNLFYPCPGIFELMDITNFTQTEYLIQLYRPDVVINTAAISQPDQCERNKTECWQVNYESVKNLVKLSKQCHFHLIHFSTDFIFDGLKEIYTEHDVPNPLSFYGLSKAEAEKYIIENCERWTIFRPIQVYGYMKNLSRLNLVLKVIDLLNRGESFHAADDQFRMPVLADDVAAAVINCAENDKYGIYNLSGTDSMCIYNMALETAVEFDLPLEKIIPVKTMTLKELAKRPLKTGFDISIAYQELNFTPLSFKDGLKTIKKQMQENF